MRSTAGTGSANSGAPVPDGSTSSNAPANSPAPKGGSSGDSSGPAAPMAGNAVQSTGETPLLTGTISEQQALDETLLGGPRAAAARAQVGITRALYAQATVMPNPTVDMDNGYAELSYRLGFGLQVEPPWKIVLRLLAAKAEVGRATVQMLQALWSLRADTRRIYTEFVIAQDSVVMMHELAELTYKLADVAQKRFQAGDVAKLDVYKAQLAASQADIESNQAARRVIQAREQLNIIMGRSEDAPLEVPKLAAFTLHAEKIDLLPDLARPMPPLAVLIDEALKNRLEIKLVKQELKAARANMRNTVGNIIPNPTIAAGRDIQLNPPDGKTEIKWYFVGSFPFPVFDVQQGEIARLKATIRQLNYEMVSQQNIVRSQVALAYRKVVNSRENIRKYQGNVLAQSEQVAELARLSYRLGQTDITSALLAQQANIQVRNQYLNEVLNYQQAFTDLEQSVGHVLQ